ncbi:polysaccharide deacetylase family protein [Legionella impletisoli]|uniref:Polysaccharide deacetylase n=1 Tax=Legionella impletisoli TaxID=343510 RepID=A0A917NA15_9GAMM|nr:polysaccharide deacetylase family protein [Legionella impletisoli]GGI80510.1 polysaccharide deacetylase [Legionella impletisoli]
MLRRYGFILLMLSIFSTFTFAQVREIAITIDDLPFVGTTHNKPGNLQRERERFLRILASLKEHNVPATGFVVAGTIEKDQWDLLEEFKNAGLTIGNHTYSHINLNRSSADKYITDIAQADKVLAPLMTGPKYFRYPYLAEGKGETKEAVLNFLTENQYIVAPVTVDSKDFKFNAALLAIHWRNRDNHINRIKNQYLDYIWRQTLRAEKKANGKPVKQILLIHANLLNSHVMGDIIQMYKDHGYKFITLTEALSNTDNAEPEVITTPVAAEVREEDSGVL